ncbi:hypothetical protein RintRC_0434 [Richelia intracellularis]|nr:hypothetical protein RintRC_0434 [Richelia intracellularis]
MRLVNNHQWYLHNHSLYHFGFWIVDYLASGAVASMNFS